MKSLEQYLTEELSVKDLVIDITKRLGSITPNDIDQWPKKDKDPVIKSLKKIKNELDYSDDFNTVKDQLGSLFVMLKDNVLDRSFMSGHKSAFLNLIVNNDEKPEIIMNSDKVQDLQMDKYRTLFGDDYNAFRDAILQKSADAKGNGIGPGELLIRTCFKDVTSAESGKGDLKINGSNVELKKGDPEANGGRLNSQKPLSFADTLNNIKSHINFKGTGINTLLNNIPNNLSHKEKIDYILNPMLEYFLSPEYEKIPAKLLTDFKEYITKTYINDKDENIGTLGVDEIRQLIGIANIIYYTYTEDFKYLMIFHPNTLKYIVIDADKIKGKNIETIIKYVKGTGIQFPCLPRTGTNRSATCTVDFTE